jgi:apolipoprotein N-acyltransferase
MGNAMAPSPSLVQWYEYTGALGGTVWILLVNMFVFTTLLHYSERKKGKAPVTLWIGLGVLLIPAFFSMLRYFTWEEKGEVYKVVVVQPNIDPYNEKFAGMDVLKQLERITDLADSKASNETDFLVAPETAIPNGIWEEDFKVHPYINYLKKWMGKYPNAQLVIGASTYHTFGPGETPSITARKFNDGDAFYDSYNTALQIDCTGVNSVYHKSKLVLGVESMPFPETLSFLQEIVIDLGGTTGSLGKQDEAGVFQNPKSQGIVAPVICYESVYGEYVTEYAAKGANLIFVITNDGWWGDTPGYRQHVTFSSLRAIETRKAIARSANTGISCFVNQRGDIIQATPWWEKAVISADLAANPDDTFYVRYGDYIGRICGYASLLAAAGLFILILIKKIRKQ